MRDASIDIDDVAEAGGEPRVVRIERIQLEIVRIRSVLGLLSSLSRV